MNRVTLGAGAIVVMVVYNGFANCDLRFGGSNIYGIGYQEWSTCKYLYVQVFDDEGIEVRVGTTP